MSCTIFIKTFLYIFLILIPCHTFGTPLAGLGLILAFGINLLFVWYCTNWPLFVIYSVLKLYIIDNNLIRYEFGRWSKECMNLCVHWLGNGKPQLHDSFAFRKENQLKYLFVTEILFGRFNSLHKWILAGYIEKGAKALAENIRHSYWIYNSFVQLQINTFLVSVLLTTPLTFHPAQESVSLYFTVENREVQTTFRWHFFNSYAKRKIKIWSIITGFVLFSPT